MPNLRHGRQTNGSNRSIWWLLIFVASFAFSGLSHGQGVSILHNFGDGTVTGDGQSPQSSLVEDSSGNFYGTSLLGGAYSYGCVFKITSGGTLTILHSFNPANGDGISPVGGLVLASDGNLYGTTSGGGSAQEGTVFQITTGGALTILHSFGDNSVTNDGAVPEAGLIQGADGNLYGTTSHGGAAGKGTIFETQLPAPFRLIYTFILHSFGDGTVTNDGNLPGSGLVEDAEGNFYGTTPTGGMGNVGVVYKLNLQQQLSTIYNFAVPASVSFSAGVPPSGPGGFTPNSRLALGTDGNLYGTTQASSYGYGAVYKVTPQGVESVVHYFGDGTVTLNGVNIDGKEGGQGDQLLIKGADGNFYGTTSGGGSKNAGTVFKVTPAGQVTILHSFADGTVSSDGGTPKGGVLEDANGNFYGTTSAGGSRSEGAIFKVVPGLPEITSSLAVNAALNQSFSYQIVATNSPFNYNYDTLPPGLGLGANGLIAGVPTALGTTNVTITVTNAAGSNSVKLAITVLPPPVITSILDDFASTTAYFYYQIRASGSPSNFSVAAGSLPAGLSLNATGLITGTPTVTGTFSIPITATNVAGSDTETLTLVISSAGPNFSQQYLILHNFNDGSVSGEGGYPGPLVQARDSTFFAVTAPVGTVTTSGVSQLTSAADANVFANLGAPDGSTPHALVQGTDGNFYGTTPGNGTTTHGTVFKVAPNGTVTTLHTFGDGSVTNDGDTPVAGLVQAEDGFLYGTTQYGGTASLGTIFKTDISGHVTIVHSFTGTAGGDGAQPVAALVDNGGTLYGTTLAGGVSVNTGNGTVDGGTAFVLYANGNYSVLHNFGDGSVSGDGLMPHTALTNFNGNLYGTTLVGGAYQDGTAFAISLGGAVTILHSFGNSSVANDGVNPISQMVAASLPTKGTVLFGTTQTGVTAGQGTVFELDHVDADLDNETILHSFGDTGTPNDGQTPLGGLIMGVDGNLYGTTMAGGAGYGTFYTIVLNGMPPASTTFPATYWKITSGMLPPGMSFDSTTGTISGTPTSGDSPSNYVIVITPYVDGVAQPVENLALAVSQTFSAWTTANSVLGASPGSASSPGGLPNLLKYLYDLNPNAAITPAEHANLPTPGFDTTTTPGTTYLTLTYRQFALETGVTIKVQTSTDLVNWTTVNPPAVLKQVGTDTTTTNNDPIMEIGVVSTGAKQFIRLHVSSP